MRCKAVDRRYVTLYVHCVVVIQTRLIKANVEIIYAVLNWCVIHLSLLYVVSHKDHYNSGIGFFFLVPRA